MVKFVFIYIDHGKSADSALIMLNQLSDGLHGYGTCTFVCKYVSANEQS